ncbi:MAG: vitamin K epoxide reductase family protein [Simkaniaceae bacterium]|nr:vitamin K epoxide reductase family protein [Candidatus Sacchlamyda saccharinae]
MEKLPLNAIPEPWEYNPSKWSQRIRIVLIAAIAVIIAIYMGLYQWRLIDSVWDPIFGNQSMKVLDSDVSHKITSWVLVPDSILGALAYLGDIIFALAGSTRRWHDRPWLVILFGLDVIPLGIVSATLIFMQGFVVGSWCFLCLVTAVISLILVALAYDEVWSSILFLYRVWKRSKKFSIFWGTLWGRPNEIAHLVGLEMAKRRDWRD